MITCYGMSFIYDTHTELEVRLPETFTSPIPVITIVTECRVVLVVLGDNLRFFKKLYHAKGDFVVKSRDAFMVNKWDKISGCGSSD